jgi:hypothetical protein
MKSIGVPSQLELPSGSADPMAPAVIFMACDKKWVSNGVRVLYV